ncbi:MAG TPA: chemotaxis protein CheW [Polyangiaceae bacterium]|nr:chemotaxis protein CheW [Polyangiaceae bacterium]
MQAQGEQSSTPQQHVLLVRALGWYCALPVGNVTETCRPLPYHPVQGMPDFVRGVAVIRGRPTPVLHLGMLLGVGAGTAGQRFVNVLIRDRPVALEVDEVLGVRALSQAQLAMTPPLVGGALTERVEGLCVLDGALMAWLDAGRLVQNELLDLVLADGWV